MSANIAQLLAIGRQNGENIVGLARIAAIHRLGLSALERNAAN